MARKLRIQYAGAIYYVMNRGDRREAIYEDDQDWRRFVETLAEVCQKTGWQVHAYCLMSNHFHLVIETPQANLVAGLKRLGWNEEALAERRKGDPAKLVLARSLRTSTTVPLAWITARLVMGSRGYLAFLLSQRTKYDNIIN